MKNILAFLVFSALLFAAGAGDFSRAREMFFENNLALKIENQKVREAEIKKDKTLSLFLPSVDLDFTYTRLNDKIQIDKNLPVSLPPPLPPVKTQIPVKIPLSSDTTKKAALSFVWPIFTGGKILAARKASLAAEEVAKSSRQEFVDKSLIDLIRAYYGVILAREVLSVQGKKEQTLKLHLENTQKRFSQGQISNTEVLHAKVAYFEALAQKEDAQSDVSIAASSLEYLLGGEFSPSGELPLVQLPQDLSLSEHALLSKTAALSDMAKAGKQAAAGRFLPDVYLFGKRELIKQDLTLLEPLWAAGVGVKLNLMSRDAHVRELELAKLKELQANLATLQAQEALKTAQKIKKEELLKLRHKEQTLKATIELALDALNSRQKAYKAGLATSFDVVDSSLSVSRARLAIAKTRYDEVIAVAKLLEAYGRLDEFERYVK